MTSQRLIASAHPAKPLARFVADSFQTASSAVATLERGCDDATAVLALPAT